MRRRTKYGTRSGRPGSNSSSATISHRTRKPQDGMWIMDRDATTVYASVSMAEILGTTRHEMIGQSSFTYVFPEDVATVCRWFDFKKDRNADPFRFKLRRKDGSAVWVDVQGTPMHNTIGRFTGIVGTFTISNGTSIGKHIKAHRRSRKVLNQGSVSRLRN